MEPQSILRMVIGSGRDGTNMFRCPSCYEEYHHLKSGIARLIPEGDTNTVGWEGRGALVVLDIVGECGSEWSLCVGEHKGNLEVFASLAHSCKDVSPRWVANWPIIIARASQRRPPLGGFLQGSYAIQNPKTNVVTVLVPAKARIYAEILNTKANKDILDAEIRRETGRNVTVRVVSEA